MTTVAEVKAWLEAVRDELQANREAQAALTEMSSGSITTTQLYSLGLHRGEAIGYDVALAMVVGVLGEMEV